MIPGTHLIICKIVYRHLLKKTNFRLDYKAFAYGNIKPDLEKNYIKREHTYEKSIDIINSYANSLINKKMSLEEFSMGVGVVGHFVCDYFCLQHQKYYWKKAPVAHGIYEVKLHAKLKKFMRNESLKVNYNYNCSGKVETQISHIVLKLRKKYEQEPESFQKDIAYAIAAEAAVCEMLIKRRQAEFGLRKFNKDFNVEKGTASV